MNHLLLIDPILTFGDGGHPFCESGFSVVNKRILSVIDTGFTLGFAFSKKSLPKFKFTNGYVLSMLLGNSIPVKGIAFSVELIVRKQQQDTKYGFTSVVFMDRQGEPLIGIETLRLLSPIVLDWQSKNIESGLTRY
jgi:hypothetical protein